MVVESFGEFWFKNAISSKSDARDDEEGSDWTDAAAGEGAWVGAGGRVSGTGSDGSCSCEDV